MDVSLLIVTADAGCHPRQMGVVLFLGEVSMVGCEVSVGLTVGIQVGMLLLISSVGLLKHCVTVWTSLCLVLFVHF